MNSTSMSVTDRSELERRINEVLTELVDLSSQHSEAVPTMKGALADILAHEATLPAKVATEDFKPETLSKSKIQAWIDNLPIESAETRLMISNFVGKTIKVGEVVIQIGKKIIEFIIALCKRYPNTLAAVILALVLSAIIAAIPIIGPAISGIVTPILLAVFMIGGIKQDFEGANRDDRLAMDIARYLHELKRDVDSEK